MAPDKERLVLDNLKLVRWIIQTKLGISPNNERYEELYQEGCLQLVEAAEKFDMDRGVKFTTFAVPTITGKLKTFSQRKILYKGLIVSRAITDLRTRMAKLQEEKPELSLEEIASELNVSVVQVSEAMLSVGSLDINIETEDDSELSLADMIGHDEPGYLDLEADDLEEYIIRESKKYLSDTQMDMLEELIYSEVYGNEQIKQGELAECYGVTRSSISRHLSKIRDVVTTILSRRENV